MSAFLIYRFILLLMGISLLAFGVAISILSNLGTSPISSLPYVWSESFPWSVGVFTILMHVLMIILQMLILGKQFQWQRWLQLPLGIVFGFMIDGFLWLLHSWTPESYLIQLSFSVVSCVITAFAVCLLVKANLVFLAAEGLYQAISSRFGYPFANCKISGDLILVCCAVISSWIFLQHIVGVREGTLISALLIGSLVKVFLPRLSFLDFNQTKSTL